MSKKYVVVFVFGEDAARAYNDGGFEKMREQLENGDGRLVKREFDTEAEVRAYQQGVEDMDGWWGCSILDDDDVRHHPRIIERLNKGH